MATIVSAMAMTHSPGLTGWFERASKNYQEQALRAIGEMRERLAKARPDAVVVFSNDHLLNWPINNTPEYTVGIGAEHIGPADWRSEEHTSELQSRRDLVCRLLLEKKKKKITTKKNNNTKQKVNKRQHIT